MFQKRIDDLSCKMLYLLGYSLEDIGEVWKMPNGTFASPSTISKILQKYPGIERGPVRVPPDKFPQTTIGHLSVCGRYQNVMELYEMTYSTREAIVLRSRAKTDFKTLSNKEKNMLITGKNFYMLTKNGVSIEKIATKMNVTPEEVSAVIYFFVEYIKKQY